MSGERPIGNRRLGRAWLNRVYCRSGCSCWRNRGARGGGACVAASLVVLVLVVDVGAGRVSCAACGWNVGQPAAQRTAGLAIYHLVSVGAAGGLSGGCCGGVGRVWGVDGSGYRRVLVALRRMRCRG